MTKPIDITLLTHLASLGKSRGLTDPAKILADAETAKISREPKRARPFCWWRRDA